MTGVDRDIAVLIVFAVYVVLQMIAVVKLTGILRLLSLSLAGFMVVAVALTTDAYLGRISPWTIFLHLATPPAVVLVTGLLVLGSLSGSPSTHVRSRHVR